jgi:hypothetical protein
MFFLIVWTALHVQEIIPMIDLIQSGVYYSCMKRTLIIVSIAILLALVILSGCNDGKASQLEPAPSPTPAPLTITEPVILTVPELLEKVSEAHSLLTTFKGNGEMSLRMTFFDGSKNEEMAMDTTFYTEMDIENRNMMFDMNMIMPGLRLDEPIDTQSLMYMIDDTLYMKIKFEDQEEQWMKQEITTAEEDEAWEAISEQVSQDTYFKILEASNFEAVGVETTNGTDYYVLQGNPDLNLIMDELTELYQGTGIENLPFDLGDMCKKVYVKYLISQDTYMLTRSQIDLTLYFEQYETKVTGELAILQNYFGYGSAISFILPEEAKKAVSLESTFASTIPDSPPLFEYQGDFQTRDINKAQMESSFPIITPDYLPLGIKNLPTFEGVLRRYQISVSANLTEGASSYAVYSRSVDYEEENAEISMTYVGVNSYLHIEESLGRMSLGDPDYNPGLKYVDILGIKAIFSEGNEQNGSRAYISFQRDGLSFILQSDNIPNRDVLRIAESMVSKELPKIDVKNPEIWPWGEAYGRYYTNDITLAQKETEFLIITPRYIPDVFNQPSPHIEGQLASLEANTIDTVKLLFFTAVLRESSTNTYRADGGQIQKSKSLLPVILEISEQSTPFPDQPKYSDDVEYTTVPGTDISIWTHDILDMQLGGVTFKQGDIYIGINFADLALAEVIKVVESIISQDS